MSRASAVTGRPGRLTVAAAAVAAVAAVGGCGRPQAAAPAPQQDSPAVAPAAVTVQVARAERHPIGQTLELTANLLPRRRTVIVAEVDGVIQSIPPARQKINVEVHGQRLSALLSLDLGVPVKKGDVLVQLDRRDFELELSAAKARLQKARRDLAQLLAWRRPEEIARLRAGRDAEAARLELAHTELRRIQELRAKAAASQSECDRLQAEVKTAQAALDQAEAELKIALAGPTAEEVAVAKAAVALAEADVAVKQRRLAKTTIRAPYDGVVTDRYVDIGDRVTAMPRVEIMELMDLSLVVAEVAVPERYTGRIHVGDRALVRAEGAEQPVPGLVVLVNEKVDTETRSFRARVAVDNRPRRFKAGQLALVSFSIASNPAAVTVPAAALTYDGGQAQVFVYRDGRVQARPVRTGMRDQQRVEITHGLRPDEWVVVRDPAVLSDGMRVRLAAAPPQPALTPTAASKP